MTHDPTLTAMCRNLASAVFDGADIPAVQQLTARLLDLIAAARSRQRTDAAYDADLTPQMTRLRQGDQ